MLIKARIDFEDLRISLRIIYFPPTQAYYVQQKACGGQFADAGEWPAFDKFSDAVRAFGVEANNWNKLQIEKEGEK